MKQIKYCLLLILSLLLQSVSGQTLERAKGLIRQEQYLEAAKLLRPLADNGDAEAQYWAACLFFDGKGVQKSDDQGIKYSTMSADKGFLPSIHLLVNYYEERDPLKYFKTLQKYVVMYPHLSDDIFGCKLGYAIVSGFGTEKDEEKGWSIIDKSKYCLDFIVEKGVKREYYMYKARKSGGSCLEDYAEYLFDNDKSKELGLLIDYMYTAGDLDSQEIYNKAVGGNAWAMAYCAVQCAEKGDIKLAKIWAKRSVDAGSTFGKYVLNQVNQHEKKKISYYVFGTKKELGSTGCIDLNGVIAANFNREYATEIDNTIIVDIKLYSSNAKLLSSHPQGTYQLQKDRQGKYVLKITNPQMFWQQTDLLVIQTNLMI